MGGHLAPLLAPGQNHVCSLWQLDSNLAENNNKLELSLVWVWSVQNSVQLCLLGSRMCNRHIHRQSKEAATLAACILKLHIESAATRVQLLEIAASPVLSFTLLGRSCASLQVYTYQHSYSEHGAHLFSTVLNHSTSPSGHKRLPHSKLSNVTVAASAAAPLSAHHATILQNPTLLVTTKLKHTVPARSTMSQRMMTAVAVSSAGTAYSSEPSM